MKLDEKIDRSGWGSGYGQDRGCPLEHVSVNDSMGQKKLQQEIEVKFAPKKGSSQKLSEVYRRLGYGGRSARVAECGSFLEFHVGADRARLHMANFCRDRLCPMCNWRRSLKIFGQVSRIMDVIQDSGYQFLFLTLTVKNCSAEHLPDTVQVIFDGWRNLYRCKAFRDVVQGTFRSLEVTRNKKTGEFHPHIHVILAVRSDYFSRNYVTQKEWGEMWRSACHLDYNPVIDVRKVKALPDGEVDGYLDGSRSIQAAVAEASKYAVKDSDFLRGTESECNSYVSAFLESLSRRRLCDFTGCFRSVKKLLDLDDLDHGDLVQVGVEQLRSDVEYMIVRYSWRAGVYVRL